MKSAACLAILCLTLACTSTRDQMQSWVGSTSQEFIDGSGLGPPEDVRSDGKGGKILVWGSPNATQTFIYVDANDAIYGWRVNTSRWVSW